MRTAVRSKSRPFHIAAAPAPAEVPVRSAASAATEPASATAPVSIAARRRTSVDLSARISTARKRTTWKSLVILPPVNAASR